MKLLRPLGFRQVGFALLSAMLLGLTLPVSAVQALTPGDLIVVFNRNLVESKAVANYYAQKRRVPWGNLVGVAVTADEQMTRQEYEQSLLPPVREAAKKLRAQGKNPAILLVYGLPLRVLGPAETDADRTFQILAVAKAKEYQVLVSQMLQEMDHLTGAAAGSNPATAGPLTYPTTQVLKKAGESITRAAQILKNPASSGEPEIIRQKIFSLFIRLAGTAPEARKIMAEIAKGNLKEREALQNQELLWWHTVLRRGVDEQMFRGTLPEQALETATAIRLINGLVGELEFWEGMKILSDRPEKTAAVDSELTLALVDRYQLAKWLPNPFNDRFDQFPGIAAVRQRTMMVGRLDGSTPEIARRLVDDAMEVEAVGLKGVFYIDARGLQGDNKIGSYAWFDRHLINLYERIKQHSAMKVVLDEKPEVFPPGSCPEAALYCGWYSLGNYVPACKWVKGAVGYHVASAEATTLKQQGSNVWCKRLLEEGVAATLGPVAEPYLNSFPLPDEFFPLLMTGQTPLLEVYFRTLPQVSWMQILIGDPLYTPFKKNPALGPEPASKKEAK